MPTQSVSIAVLLAGDECRRENLYAGGQVFGTVMRHESLAVAVVLRARRVIEPAGAAALMSPPRLALLAPPRRLRAGPRAVALAAIAAAADEEDLPALGAEADDEAQRVHGLGRAAKNWTPTARRATNTSSLRSTVCAT
jgi:hypothetical protein